MGFSAIFIISSTHSKSANLGMSTDVSMFFRIIAIHASMIAAMLIFSYFGMFLSAILVKSLVNFKSVPKAILPLGNGHIFSSNIVNKPFTKDYSAIWNVQLLIYCF